jgi:MFS family permease
MACVSTTMGIIFVMFFLSVYSEYLAHEVNVSEKYIGFIFGIFPGSFFVSAPIAGFISKKTPRIFLAQTAFFSVPISLILYGPSKLLNLP